MAIQPVDLSAGLQQKAPPVDLSAGLQPASASDNPNFGTDQWYVEKIGSAIPEAAIAPMEWFQKNVNEPLNTMAERGKQLAELATEPIEVTPGEGLSGLHIAPEGTLEAHHPIAGAIEKGIAGVVGGTVSDPRNWPLLGASSARPLLQRAISGGFGVMMGTGAIDTANDLSRNWDSYSPSQRWEKMTSAGLQTLMTGGALTHALSSDEAPAKPADGKLRLRGTAAAPTPVDLSAGLQPAAEPIPPGPGGMNVGTGIREGGSDIVELGDAIRRNASPDTPVTERLKVADQVSSAASQGADAVTSGFTKLKATGQALWDAYSRPEEWTDFDDARGKWDGAIQKASYDAMQFAKDIKEGLPDKVRREAITNYIQAAGDENLLRQRAAQSDSKLASGYEAAANLTPEEKLAAQNVSNYFDSKLQQAKDSGMLSQGIENYVNQIWDRSNPVGDKLRADVDYGKLATNPALLKKRIFDSYFEGEQAGFTPKNKDIGFLITAYDQAFNKAVASRAFIKSMIDGEATDGRPLLVANADRASTIVNPEGNIEAYLIRPKFIGEEYADYRPIDHPALRQWRWIGKDADGNPIFHNGDLWVHPEAFKPLKANLGTSALRQWTVKLGDTEYRPIAGLMEKSQKIKGSILGYSFFHQVQESVHAVGHWVNPFHVRDTIDLEDPTQMKLLEHGLQISNARAQEEFMDGHAQAYAYRIPIVGRMAQGYSDWLFHDFIPNLKMKTALDILERNTRRYGNKLSEDQLLALSARQANAAYGELNYNTLGRSKTMQDAFRLMGLAPDFLEARGRFVAQGMRPYGREQLIALARLTGILYGTARVGNALLNNGSTHPEKPFAVTYGGKDYFLRSVPGDIEHLISDPRNFVWNRLNPITTKPAVEALTGRDEWGRVQHLSDLLNGTLKGWTPILIQKAIKNPADYKIWDSLLQSVGIANIKSYSAGAKAARTFLGQNPSINLNPDKSAQTSRLAQQYAAGSISAQELVKMVGNDQLTEKQLRKIEDRSPQFVKDFARLPIEQALQFWPDYSPEEQTQLRGLLAHKAAGIGRLDRTISQKQALAAEVNARLTALNQRGVLKLRQ